jgi:cytochrome c5
VPRQEADYNKAVTARLQPPSPRCVASATVPASPESPKAGNKASWAPRIAEGKATLYEHALKGYQGKSGVMPAKGARADLSDDLIKQGVDYMVQIAQ